MPENQGYNFDILSGESLFIANSEVIAFVIAILNAFLNPDDQVVRAELNFLYYQKIWPRLKESEVRSPKSEEGRRKTEVPLPEQRSVSKGAFSGVRRLKTEVRRLTTETDH
jgi:hypothetical protein